MYFLILNLLQVSASCNLYSCKPSTMSFSEGTCVYPSKSSYYLSPCPNSQQCSVAKSGNSTCNNPIPPIPQPSYPGESCITSADCEYGQCENKICIGNHWLEPCTSTSQCHVGLYCLDSICWFQRDEYEECSQDTDCKNNMGCYIKNINNLGYCVKYYSLPEKDWVYNCNNQRSDFCESGNCAGPGGKGVCIDGIKPRYLQTTCKKDSDCIGEGFGWEFYSTCECGYNGKGTMYCQPFLGDYLGVEYLKLLKSWYSSDKISTCHTDRRMSEECMKQWKSYQEYLKALYLWSFFPQIQENDECVRKIYTDYYWEL